MRYNIENLKQYMITNEDYISIVQKHNLHKKENAHKFTRLKKENKILKFHSNAQKNFFTYDSNAKKDLDLYFLCFYYFYNDDKEMFDEMYQNYSTIKQSKYEIIEDLPNHKEKAKRKFKIDDLSNKLGSMLHLDRSDVSYLCIAYDLNIIFYNKSFYEVHTNNGDSGLYIFYDVEQDTFMVQQYTRDHTNISYLLSKKYEVRNLDEPIRPIGTYKLQQLKDICSVLSIDISTIPGKVTKAKLYDLICNHI